VSLTLKVVALSGGSDERENPNICNMFCVRSHFGYVFKKRIFCGGFRAVGPGIGFFGGLKFWKEED